MEPVIAVAESAFVNGRLAAKAYVERRGIDGPARAPVETLIGVYDAVRKSCANHYAALYVAAQETLRTMPTVDGVAPVRQAVRGSYGVPSSAAEILDRVPSQVPAVAGYCRFLVHSLEPMLEDLPVPGVCAAGRTYVFAKPPRTSTLVGLEHEQALLRKYAAQLFLYDPKTRENPDRGAPHHRLPAVVLLSGPPGTGKSSLIEDCTAEGRRLSRLLSMPFTVQYFESTQYSKWLGGSQRNVRRQFERTRDPRGVGLLVLEDVDLLLADGDHESAAIRHVRHYVMNALSGRDSQAPNALTVMTTNEPGALGKALYSRTVNRLEINPFTRLAVHAQFWRKAFPQMTSLDHEALARDSLAGELTGRDLDAIVTSALDATTRAPTDDELLSRAASESRYGAVSLDLVQKLLGARATAARTVARHS